MKYVRIRKLIIASVLLLVLVFILAPLWVTLVLSFDRTTTTSIVNFSFWPKEFSTFNYEVAASFLDLKQYYLNTIFVTIVNTFISVFTALCCGYAFAKGHFALKKLWYVLFLSVMMVPFEVKLIPLYLQYNSWGLVDTYWPLILGNFAYAYGILFARQNIANIPDSLRESAYIDGAGEWKIFFKIIAPLSKPVIATLSILQIIANWNSYLWPLVIIRTRSKQLISVGVSLFNSNETQIYYGPRMAVAIISAIPLVIMFLIMQKNIVHSIAVSGIKE